jgi:diguanylate cyclase (GGDEF)-like protein
VELIRSHILEFIILALLVILVVLIFSLINMFLRLKAEKEREEARKHLQTTNFELEAAYQQLIASESELNRQFKELKVKEVELRNSRERYRLAAKGSEFGIWDYDYEKTEMYFSRKAKELLNLSTDQYAFESKTYYNCLTETEQFSLRSKVSDHIEHKTNVLEHETFVILDGGQIEWVSIRGKALFDEQGLPLRIAGSLRSITQEKEDKIEIKRIAFTDELTSLSNRASFNQLVKTMNDCETCQRAILLLIDINDFKIVNDSLGHYYGDQALKKLAEILTEEIGNHGKLFRMGGDEFVILVSNLQNELEVEAFVGRLFQRIKPKFEIDGIGMQINLCIGSANYPDDSQTLEVLLKHADLALHEAKRNGKNQYCAYEPQFEEVMKQNLWFEDALNKALEGKEFELYYQPKLRLNDNKILGFEALIRWNHPEKGMISPDEFIPIAEEKGFINSIGEWVIGEAINQLNNWHLEGHTTLTMSINLSAKQLKEVNLIESIMKTMKHKVIKPSHIEFEITETTALHDIDFAMELLQKLRNLGFKISLDDFGTGYSSLNYLNMLPIDILKIDRTFIEGSVNNDQRKQIIKTVIQLAHANHMEVVAEGVETYEQFLFLKEENCDILQGYYISKPEPPARVLEIIKTPIELFAL